jgi:hypothetical protein
MTEPAMDAHGEVRNGPETSAAIAETLQDIGCVLIGWSDGDGSHYDIVFALRPRQFGTIMTGVRGPAYLFVGICRVGCFGFAIDDRTAPLRAEYVAEKLSLQQGETASAIARLINGVLAELGA